MKTGKWVISKFDNTTRLEKVDEQGNEITNYTDDELGALEFLEDAMQLTLDMLQKLTAKTDNELKPCPFCGGDSIELKVLIHDCGEDARIWCRECPCSMTKMFDSRKDAIAAWNRRKNNE